MPRNGTPHVRLTMTIDTYNTLCSLVEEYAIACKEDGEANESSNNIADLLMEYRRGGGLRRRDPSRAHNHPWPPDPPGTGPVLAVSD